MPPRSNSSRKVPVVCALRDCVYHEPALEGGESDHAFCYHPDKPMNMRVEPCPLYRLDWKRKGHVSNGWKR